MKKVIYLLVLLITCEINSYAQTVSGNVVGHDYVDLGLPSGKKWATCNIGATKSIEYGDYFAWGETQAKDEYSWDNYKWAQAGGHFITKYCTKAEEGTLDKKTTLEKADDAASTNWGSSWCMPTNKDMQELLDGCTWEWTHNYDSTGVAGRIGHSKANGNTIFLPAAGVLDGTDNSTLKSEGYYWTSTLSKNSMNGSYFLCFGNYYIDWKGNKRYNGRSVRAVVSDNVVTSKGNSSAKKASAKKTIAKK